MTFENIQILFSDSVQHMCCQEGEHLGPEIGHIYRTYIQSAILLHG